MGQSPPPELFQDLCASRLLFLLVAPSGLDGPVRRKSAKASSRSASSQRPTTCRLSLAHAESVGGEDLAGIIRPTSS